jgi:hypothetical protein
MSKNQINVVIIMKSKANEIKSNIEQTDKVIDQMVYALYGLTEEEIEIVERSFGR